MTKRVLTALMAVALLCTMLPAMALANTGSMYVQTSNGGSVHLRKDPIAPANNVLTDVPYGAVVDVLGYLSDRNWAHVAYTSGGRTWDGYMMTRYLVVQKPESKNNDCRVMMRCYAGYSLTVIAQDKNWAQVSDPQTGYVGFINRSFITTVSDGTSVGAVLNN